MLKNEILSIKEGLKKGWYYGERYNLEQEIKKKETLLNYISELEKDNKRYEKELHGVLKYSISKHVIRDKIEELYNTEVDRKDFYLNENDVKRRNIDLLEELLEGE